MKYRKLSKQECVGIQKDKTLKKSAKKQTSFEQEILSLTKLKHKQRDMQVVFVVLCSCFIEEASDTKVRKERRLMQVFSELS